MKDLDRLHMNRDRLKKELKETDDKINHIWRERKYQASIRIGIREQECLDKHGSHKMAHTPGGAWACIHCGHS